MDSWPCMTESNADNIAEAQVIDNIETLEELLQHKDAVCSENEANHKVKILAVRPFNPETAALSH